MSGPVSTDDAPLPPDGATPASEPRRPGAPDGPAGLETIDGRAAEVGGFGVRRVLPRRPRRSVGAWCFADHMGPGRVTAGRGLDIGPHPHIGLQTVTWLVRGAVRHRDSLGSEQLIRPGELNLMTAGHGVAHSEETTGSYAGELHGVQLWVALPAATRDGPAAFEHHADLPRAEVGAGTATVLVGSFVGAVSPARRDTDHVGVDIDLGPGRCELPLAPAGEHALVVLDGRVEVDGRSLQPGRLGYLAPGRDELSLDAAAPARVLLLGGTPFPDPLVMWWNYVARTRDEITEAHRDWTAGTGRFPPVASPLDRIEVPGPPWGPPG